MEKLYPIAKKYILPFATLYALSIFWYLTLSDLDTRFTIIKAWSLWFLPLVAFLSIISFIIIKPLFRGGYIEVSELKKQSPIFVLFAILFILFSTPYQRWIIIKVTPYYYNYVPWSGLSEFTALGKKHIQKYLEEKRAADTVFKGSVINVVNIKDYGEDTDNNGKYNYITIELNLNFPQEYIYQIFLDSPLYATQVGENMSGADSILIDEKDFNSIRLEDEVHGKANGQVHLTAGLHTIKLKFLPTWWWTPYTKALQNYSGPYNLCTLRILASGIQMLPYFYDYGKPGKCYGTANYSKDDFDRAKTWLDSINVK